MTLFIVAGLTLLGGGRLNPIGIIILSLIGYHLWCKHTRWRVAAMLLAGVNALVLGISFYQGDGVLGSLMWLAYLVAVVLVLTGDSQRWRTLTSIGVYAIGHIGILAVLFILGIISSLS